MADCLGLCEYVDDVCMGCGRDFSLAEPEDGEAAAPKGNAASNEDDTAGRTAAQD